MNRYREHLSSMVGEIDMPQARFKKSAFAENIQWLVILFCLLLLSPTAALAVCASPTLTVDSATRYGSKGSTVDYLVTFTHGEAGSCAYDLSVADDTSGITATLPGGVSYSLADGATVTVTVTVDSTVADWAANITTLTIDTGGSGTIDMTTTANNLLLHNSITMGSSKWNSNWGNYKADSMYGAFTCKTCHTNSTSNIKRVKTLISTGSANVWAGPGTADVAVIFQSADEATGTDMGDDSGGHNTSNRICEVCHSATKYHRYDTTGQTSTTHYNTKDCTLCHPHSAGFKASCASCHGGGTTGSVEANYWPDGSSGAAENDVSGRHQEHMEALAQLVYGIGATALLNDADADSKQKALCAYCHDTPGADADHTTAGTAEVAMHPAWAVADAASGSYTTADGNCTNICHNNKPTGAGGGAATYGWLDSGTSSCLMCHNDITVTTAGTTGATHDRHLTMNYGPTVTCSTCHDASTDWAGNLKPASGHLDGVLAIVGSKVAADEYNGTSPPGGASTGVLSPGSFGSCSGGSAVNSCHRLGGAAIAPLRPSYTWGSILADDCASCHQAVPLSNSHPVHVATARTTMGGANWATNTSQPGFYDFGCGNCHPSNQHLTGDLNVVVPASTSPVYPAGTFNVVSKKCSTNVCHQDGQNGSSAYVVTEPTWGTPFAAGACNGCHGNHPPTGAHGQHAVEVGFHYSAIYSGLTDFLPVTDADAASVDQALDDGDGDSTAVSAANPGYDQLRGHGGNLLADGSSTATVISCNVCHYQVIQVNSNDQGTACVACHDGAAAPLQGNVAIFDKSLHVNGTINVRYFEEKIRSKAQVRDEKPYSYTLNSGTGETVWTKTTELTNNWHRFNGYKRADGASYDEQPYTLHQLATDYQFAADGTTEYYNTTDKTCMISCHLWEAGRVDKIPVHWVDNATGGSAPLMCIDCHSRLPK